jgi:hypothetical protein
MDTIKWSSQQTLVKPSNVDTLKILDFGRTQENGYHIKASTQSLTSEESEARESDHDHDLSSENGVSTSEDLD